MDVGFFCFFFFLTSCLFVCVFNSLTPAMCFVVREIYRHYIHTQKTQITFFLFRRDIPLAQEGDVLYAKQESVRRAERAQD